MAGERERYQNEITQNVEIAMKTDALSIAQTYVNQVKRAGVPVKEAYLFGSYAKGKVWEGSDIDICIVSNSFGKNYFSEKQLLNRLALQTDPRIEPVAYSSSDFDNKYDALTDEVKRFGVKVA